jgi:putative PEP-CTERM system histidine kinase
MFEIILSSVSAGLLLILAIYTLVKQRNITGVMFSLSVILLAAIEIIDQASIHMEYDPVALKKIVLHLESFLPAILLFYSLTYARQISDRAISGLWWGFLGISVIFPLSTFLLSADSFFYSPDLQIEQMMFLGNAGYWFYMGLMVYCIMALMNVEATYSAASVSEKWRIKFEVIGFGSILAVLIFYFSQGLLYRSINMNLVPIRSGVFILASALIGYARIFRGDGVRIAVSQYILYRSLTLLTVGLYLLILGLIGEGLRYFGVSFSRDLTIFTAFATGIGMIIVLLSGRARRKAVVFLRKHFFAQKHEYRDEWLKFTGRLSSCKTVSDVYNAILTTYRETFGLKGSSLYLIDKETKEYKPVLRQNMPGGEQALKISDPMHLYLVNRERVLNTSDGEYRPEQEDAALIKESGARLIVPLINDSELTGFLALGDQLAPEKLIYEDYDLMKTLARQATYAVLNFRLSEELGETREIAAVARISAFVIHDLKNLATSLSLVLENARSHIGNAEFQHDMLETIGSTVDKMKGLMQRLKTVPEKKRLESEVADLSIIAKSALHEVNGGGGKTSIVCRGSSVISKVDCEEMKNVIVNMILNALDATKGKGAIEVETGIENGLCYISVKDDGCGMEREFIENHLFKPFRTTKKKGLGIGLYQCRQIVAAHGGRIQVESSPGKGAVFTVYLPAVEKEVVAG